MGGAAVAAKLTVEEKAALERLLGGRTLGAWLRELLTDREALEQDRRQAEEHLATLKRKLAALEGQAAEWELVVPFLKEVARSGVAPEELAQAVAEYGDLMAACNALRRQKSELEVAVAHLEDRRAEAEGAIAAIAEGFCRKVGTVRTEAEASLHQVERAALRAIEDLKKAARDYAELRALKEQALGVRTKNA